MVSLIGDVKATMERGRTTVGPDEPDYGDRPGRQASADGGDYGTVRQCVEQRSRSEYAAELGKGWAADGWSFRRGLGETSCNDPKLGSARRSMSSAA